MLDFNVNISIPVARFVDKLGNEEKRELYNALKNEHYTDVDDVVEFFENMSGAESFAFKMKMNKLVQQNIKQLLED